MTDIKARADLTGLVQQWARDSRDYEQLTAIIVDLFAQIGLRTAFDERGVWVWSAKGERQYFPSYILAVQAQSVAIKQLLVDQATDEPVGEGETPAEEPDPPEEPADAPVIEVLPEEPAGYELKVKHSFGNTDRDGNMAQFQVIVHSDAPGAWADRIPTNERSLRLFAELEHVDAAMMYLRHEDDATLDLADELGIDVIMQGRARKWDDEDVKNGKPSNADIMDKYLYHARLAGVNFGDDFTDPKKNHTPEYMQGFYDQLPKDKLHFISGGTQNKLEKDGTVDDPFDYAPYKKVADVSMPQIYLGRKHDKGWIATHVYQNAIQWGKYLSPTLPLYDEKGYITPANQLLCEMLMCLMPKREIAGIGSLSYYTANHEAGHWADDKFRAHMVALKQNLGILRALEPFYFYGDEIIHYGDVPTDWRMTNHYIRAWRLGERVAFVALNGSLRNRWKIDASMAIPTGTNIQMLASGDEVKSTGQYLEATIEKAGALVYLMDAPAQGIVKAAA